MTTVQQDDFNGSVLVGADISDDVLAALLAGGVAATRDDTAARIVITIRPDEIPDGAWWVHGPMMGVDRLVGHMPASVRVLTRTVGSMPDRLGAYTALAVRAERWSLHRFFRQQQNAVWQAVRVPSEDVTKTALIVGTGFVGAGVARALRPLFGRLVGVSASGVAKPEFDEVVAFGDAPWGRADVVVVTLPLTPATVNLLGARELGAMAGAHVVVIGRGATVDYDAMRAAIGAGAVRHVTADVFPVEPLPPDSWLWGDERVTVTPHIAGLWSVGDAVSSFVGARDALVAGREPANMVELARGY